MPHRLRCPPSDTDWINLSKSSCCLEVSGFIINVRRAQLCRFKEALMLLTTPYFEDHTQVETHLISAACIFTSSSCNVSDSASHSCFFAYDLGGFSPCHPRFG